MTKFKLFAVFSLLLFSFVLVPRASASQAVVNGCFSGGYSGWSFFYDGGLGSAWSGSGANGCGRVNVWGDLVSSPFRSDGGNLFFYATSDTGGCCGYVNVYVIDYVSGVASKVDTFSSLSGPFVSRSVSLSAYSGSVISVMFTSVSGAVSDISASGVPINFLPPSSLNGAFTGSIAPNWIIDSSDFVVYSDVYHDSPKSVMLPAGVGSYNSLYFFPVFSSAGSSVTAWYKGGESGGDAKYFEIVDLDSPSFARVTLGYCASWCQFDYDISSFSSDLIAFRFRVANTYQLSAFFIDDVCVLSVCSDSFDVSDFDFPTATPVATATPAETATPVATATPAETATPLGGGGGGGGGGNPVVVATVCPSDNPCYVIFATPIVVEFPTNVVVVTPTSEFGTPTAIPALPDSAGVVVSMNSSSDVSASFIDGRLPVSSSGVGGGTADDVAGMHYNDYSLSFCLPSDVFKVFSSFENCYVIPVWQITSLSYLGVDLIPLFSSVIFVLFLTTVIVRLRSK